MSWVVFAIFFAASITFVDVYKKWLIEDQWDPILIIVQSQTVMVALTLPLALLWDVQIDLSLRLLGITALSSVATLLLVEALKRDDVSLITPVASLTPIWVAFTEPIFTDKSWDPILVLSAVIVFAGVYLVLMGDDLLHPFRRITDVGVLMAFGASMGWASTSILNVQLLDAGASPVGLNFSTILLSWILFIGLWIFVRHDWGRFLDLSLVIFPLALGRIGKGLFFILAAERTDATSVEVVAQTSTLGSVAGGVLFDEEHLGKRLVGALLIVVAVVLVI